MSSEVRGWILTIVEVLNYLFLGGKNVVGGKVLSSVQRRALGVSHWISGGLPAYSQVAVKFFKELKLDLGRVRSAPAP